MVVFFADVRRVIACWIQRKKQTGLDDNIIFHQVYQTRCKEISEKSHFVDKILIFIHFHIHTAWALTEASQHLADTFFFSSVSKAAQIAMSQSK